MTSDVSLAGKLVLLLMVVMISGTSSGMPARRGHDDRSNFQSNIPVRVLLQKEAHSVTITWNRTTLFLGDRDHSTWLPAQGTIQLRWNDSISAPRVVASQPNIVSTDLWLAPSDALSGLVSLDGKHYRGAIEIKAGEDGLMVINKVSMEDYLLGLLPAEMNSNWESEALKAQAIAARSYAFYRTRNPRSPHYDMVSGTMDQVYLGEGAERPNTTIAVRATRGLFLADRGEPIEAYFHARCGGSTETSQTVWNTTAPAGSHRVACPFCKKRPYNWSATWNRTRFFQALHLTSSPFSKLFLRALTTSPTGRVTSILVATNDEEKTMTSDQLRNLLGYDQLKSTHFTWQVDADSVHFDGVGFGHGVGMCQWGARHLARQGFDFHRILAFYYPGVSLAGSDGKKDWN